MIRHRLFLCLGLGLCGLLAACRTPPTPLVADLAFVDGKIWTVDDAHPEAEALAVWQGRIVVVGSNADVRPLIGEHTQVVDLAGRRMLPGFIDNHVHFVYGGLSLSSVQLKDAADEDEFGLRLAAKDRELSDGAWILRGTWDHDNWPGGQLPTARLIDRFVPDRPVFVERYDGHMGVANSRALELAGITAATPDPPGGVIVRLPGSREPAGVLKDTAMEMMYAAVPEISLEETRQAVLAALDHARRLGVTGIHHVSLEPAALRVYQELEREGRLTARINGHWPLANWEDLAGMGLMGNFNSHGRIKIGGLKGYVDGSLGSSTALFHEPYVQDPDTSGVWVIPRDRLLDQVLAADAAGLHVAVHAIGDRANAELLDVFAEVIRANGPRDRRFRIEHAQHVAPEDFARFAELGVIASVQPYHAIDDGRWAERRIGADRCRTTYAFRTFLDHGVAMSFGSDWTVAPLDPLLGLHAAVTRQTTDGAHPDGWYPEQKIGLREAIRAYTLTSAYSSFDDDVVGSIVAGKLADLVVLSDDILTLPLDEIPDARVWMTVVGGEIVFGPE